MDPHTWGPWAMAVVYAIIAYALPHVPVINRVTANPVVNRIAQGATFLCVCNAPVLDFGTVGYLGYEACTWLVVNTGDLIESGWNAVQANT